MSKLEESLSEEIGKLRQWVSDLQDQGYVNCVYCGMRYGPRRYGDEEGIPASLSDVLTKHVETCPKHPLSKALAEIETLKQNLELKNLEIHALRTLLNGGSS